MVHLHPDIKYPMSSLESGFFQRDNHASEYQLSGGVSISASKNPFCSGTVVTFTTSPVNGGSSPAYQWKVNGNNAGTNSSLYSYSPQNGDNISCVMTSNLVV